MPPQWQCQILNPLHHKRTPHECLIFSLEPNSFLFFAAIVNHLKTEGWYSMMAWFYFSPHWYTCSIIQWVNVLYLLLLFFKHRHLFSHSSGGRGVWDQGASMIDWVLVRASFWLAEDSFLLCPHMAQGEKERERQTETDKWVNLLYIINKDAMY